MENKLRIRKVHLASLMHILSNIWDRGVDFVDIYGTVEDGQDTIGVSFSKEYMDEKFTSNFDNFNEEQLPSRVHIKLSDEDLNELI